MKKDKKVIQEAIDRYKHAIERDGDNRDRAKEAIRFRDLDQWPEWIRKSREGDPDGPRPCLTLDKVNQYVRQVVNDMRQNRPAIKVRGVDDKSDKEVAEVLQGIIRHVEDQSNADVAYDTAAECAVDGGFGYWRVNTKYVDEESFDQEPCIERIRNRFSVLMDPDHQDPTGADSKWCIVFDPMTREEFKAQYPDADEVSFEDFAGDWCTERTVVVAEYFRKVKKSKTLYELANGEVSEERPEGESVRTRKVQSHAWEWRKLTAAEELDFRELDCKYLPVVEVVGSELDIEGKRKLSGIVRPAMDSMRMYNYAASAFVEMVALAPRAPWVAANAQLEGQENNWKAANRRNISVLTYNPVMEGGALVPMPQRAQMPGIPSGWQQTMVNMEHDIQASVGMYASNLGQQTEASSGKQELALQRRGDIGTFHFPDNLGRSIRQTGRILIDLIVKTYDTARVARILGDDGQEDYARLDPEIPTAKKEIVGPNGRVKYFNLGVGKYDVTVTIGPSFATKRMEAADYMMNMLTSKPELVPIIGDLAFKALDMPYAEEIAERLKKMLPPQLQDQPEMDNLPPEVQQVLGQAQAAIQQREMLLQQQAQELAKMSETAQQDTQQAKDARAELEKEAIQLQAAREALRLSERAMKAELEAAQLNAEKQLNDMIDSAKQETHAQEEAIETHWSEDLGPKIVQSHEQMMQAMSAVLAAVSAPKVKRTTAVGPGGQTYDVETVETLQ